MPRACRARAARVLLTWVSPIWRVQLVGDSSTKPEEEKKDGKDQKGEEEKERTKEDEGVEMTNDFDGAPPPPAPHAELLSPASGIPTGSGTCSPLDRTGPSHREASCVISAGEMMDLEQPEDGDEGSEEEREEEPEHGMGDTDEQNEEVVDERLWDQEEDPDLQPQVPPSPRAVPRPA